MEIEKLVDSLAGIASPEIFLTRLNEALEGKILRGHFYFHGKEFLIGDSSVEFNYHLDSFLSLAFEQELHPEFESILTSIISSAIKNLVIIQKLRSISYRGWNHKKNTDKQLICLSPSMKACVEEAELVAPHNTAILIQGETGTGKEVLARHIQSISSRGQGKFIAVNCAALPSTLIDSTLFGHKKGAFTGADKDRKGLFESAKGGTLFLDEIGDLPLETQAALLRVLEYGDYTPVGSDEVKKSDVRIISASHKSLEESVRKGSFREDLFYRLSVFPITVPSLRERKEDIPELINSMLNELYESLKVSRKKVDSKFYQQALSYNWPGNVRELRNALEKSLILTKGSNLKLAIKSSVPSVKSNVKNFDDAVKEFLENALAKCSGKVDGEGGAAELLGLKPQTLYSKIRKYSIKKSL